MHVGVGAGRPKGRDTYIRGRGTRERWDTVLAAPARRCAVWVTDPQRSGYPFVVLSVQDLVLAALHPQALWQIGGCVAWESSVCLGVLSFFGELDSIESNRSCFVMSLSPQPINGLWS